LSLQSLIQVQAGKIFPVGKGKDVLASHAPYPEKWEGMLEIHPEIVYIEEQIIKLIMFQF